MAFGTRVMALIRQCELLVAFLETDEHTTLSLPTMLIVPNHALVALLHRDLILQSELDHPHALGR